MPGSTNPSGRAHVPDAAVPPGKRISARAAVPSARPATLPPGGPGRRPPAGPAGRPYRGRRRPHWGRIALVVVLALALLAGIAGLGVYLYGRHLDSQVARTDPFSQITGARPDRLAPGAMNILLLGSDSRNPDDTANSRTDTIILMHVQADHQHAYLISIPRDSYVYIPRSPTNPDLGDTHAKLNAAFAWGGPTLAVETVEKLTNVRIDHVVLIDFAGFQQVTDALGGVDMYVDRTITSIHKPHRTFTKGEHHFNGAEALDYVRQRKQFPDGDITREKHQQAFLKAIMDKAVSTGTLTNPGKLNAFLQAVTKAVTVDKDFSLATMAWQFHSLHSSDLTFLTAPFSGFGTEDGQSVVELDDEKDAALFHAVAKDKLAAYLGTKASPAPGN